MLLDKEPTRECGLFVFGIPHSTTLRIGMTCSMSFRPEGEISTSIFAMAGALVFKRNCFGIVSNIKFCRAYGEDI